MKSRRLYTWFLWVLDPDWRVPTVIRIEWPPKVHIVKSLVFVIIQVKSIRSPFLVSSNSWYLLVIQGLEARIGNIIVVRVYHNWGGDYCQFIFCMSYNICVRKVVILGVDKNTVFKGAWREIEPYFGWTGIKNKIQLKLWICFIWVNCWGLGSRKYFIDQYLPRGGHPTDSTNQLFSKTGLTELVAQLLMCHKLL